MGRRRDCRLGRDGGIPCSRSSREEAYFEKPDYPGGKWHVEVVSGFIHYYDSENISESRLAFRRATSEPHAHKQDDGKCRRRCHEDPHMRCIPELVSTSAFFLVDPTQTIPSATDVAPQRREWVTEAMHYADANSALANLPVEIHTMISEENDGTVTRSEAEEYMEELMAERTVFVEVNGKDYFGFESNMCEH
ncbi:hypothetical protein BJ322DRAFT_348066 [Thelephora terrestris]|uniref:DUF4246 domain-containing protein n=1 Tax=Thelephora terrestris TaxID=56493 RepID=A0A9P6L244_9AGAM|nr:hypothetical protein BJ322DRAFT_348066 [Thelephora terrestris]